MNDNESKNKYNKFFVYLITNLKNNKIYIGQTVNFENRCKQHINDSFNENRVHYPINKSIKKHGPHNFKFEIIEITENYEDVKAAEIYWIAYYNSKNRKIGYNLTDGGDGTIGHTMSEEMKKKMSDLFTGRPMLEKTKQALIKANTGRAKTDEEKKKMSDAQKGDKNHRFGKSISDEQKIIISKANKNKIVSKETKNKVLKVKQSKMETYKFSKFKNSDIINIRDANKNGITSVSLAKIYNVSVYTIYDIVNRKTWKHV